MRFLVRLAEASLALALLEAEGYEGLLLAEGPWVSRLLEAAIAEGIAPEREEPRLRIRLFGWFEVELDSKPLADKAWRGRKPQ